jgi:hypothetical protein
MVLREEEKKKRLKANTEMGYISGGRGHKNMY